MGTQYYGSARIGTKQTKAYSGTAGTIDNPVGSQTRRIRVLVTTDAYVLQVNGSDVSTAALGAYLPALTVEYFTITPGQKFSAIQVSAAGTLEVVEDAT